MKLQRRPLAAISSALCCLTLGAGMVSAAPVFQFTITGDTSFSDPQASLVQTNFATAYANGLSAGGLLFGVNDPAISIARPEVFSDPSFEFALRYEDIRTFTYFALAQSVDGEGAPLPPRFVVASEAGALTGRTLDAVLVPFFQAHPGFDTPRFIKAVVDGPDLPGGTSNADFSAVFDFINDGHPASPFAGDIGTNFQTAQTLDLVAFLPDASAGGALTGVKFGSLTVNASFIPEPATTTLFTAAGLALATRRRKTPSR